VYFEGVVLYFEPGPVWSMRIRLAYFCVFALQYFLQPKLAKEPVPQQLESIAREILVPLVSVLHRLIDKVILFSYFFSCSSSTHKFM